MIFNIAYQKIPNLSRSIFKSAFNLKWVDIRLRNILWQRSIKAVRLKNRLIFLKEKKGKRKKRKGRSATHPRCVLLLAAYIMLYEMFKTKKILWILINLSYLETDFPSKLYLNLAQNGTVSPNVFGCSTRTSCCLCWSLCFGRCHLLCKGSNRKTYPVSWQLWMLVSRD